jgi:hypothetical protein
MVHRRDLLEPFEWLSGSELLEDALDEAMVAIALCTHRHDWDLIEYGAAWMPAGGVVEVFGLEGFVEAERAERLARWSPPDRSRMLAFG